MVLTFEFKISPQNATLAVQILASLQINLSVLVFAIIDKIHLLDEIFHCLENQNKMRLKYRPKT